MFLYVSSIWCNDANNLCNKQIFIKLQDQDMFLFKHFWEHFVTT